MTLQMSLLWSPQFMLGQLAEAKNHYQHNYNKSSTSNGGMWNVYKRPSFFLFERKGAKGWRRGRHEDVIFWEFVVPKCILYCSFMFSPNAQWFKLLCLQFVPQVPNKSTLYPICFAQSHLLVNYIGSLKENTRLCPFWDWRKFHHSTTRTWLCHVKRFYFRVNKRVLFLWGGGHSKSSITKGKKKSWPFPHNPIAFPHNPIVPRLN
jgi:hypothetical protein